MGALRAWVPAFILLMCVAWAAVAWLVPHDAAVALPPSQLWHRIASVILVTTLCIHAFLTVSFEGSHARLSDSRP